VQLLPPAVLFQPLGDLERALLRNENVASADNWRSVLEPVVARYRDLEILKYFRGDAAFAIPELYSFLEDEDYEYAIRLKSNAVLEREIQHLLTRPVGRPPKKPVIRYHQFMYQAGTWDRERRVVAKVEWYQGELFPPGRFHRDEPVLAVQAGRSILQSKRHGRTVDSRG